jgi:TonB-linked SusC/RagA family outer membrane protein
MKYLIKSRSLKILKSKVMRTTVLLIMCNLLTLHATVFSQSTVTMRGENISLKKALVQLEQETQVKFVYRDEAISDFKVSFDLKNSTIEESLNILLKGTGTNFYSLENNLIVISSIELKQGTPVTGTVTDANGETLSGVNVVIQGTTTGVVTDANGKFSINAASTDVLQFSFVGYTTQNIEVGNQTNLQVALDEDSGTIEEVVVVGYGVQRKSNVTGAIAKVSGTTLEARPVARVDQALQGQMAGVHVQTSGGKPGKAATIRVRGVKSISAGNDPLYVVDGFPVDAETFSNMSLSDIESVEVLKDAASAAIYGSRGAGGVVIVTTKRGNKGKELKVDLNITSGFSKIERYLPLLSSAEQLLFIADARDDAWALSGGDFNILPMDRPWDFKYNQDWVNTARTNPSAIPEYNQVGALLRTGMDQNYQLTLSGATNNARYMISGNYYKQEGIVKNTDYTRYAFRANMDVDVNKYLTIGLNLAPAFIVSNDRNTEGKDNTIHYAGLSTSFIDPRQGYWGESDVFGDFNVFMYNYYELAVVEHLKDETNRAQVLADVYAQLNLGKGLTFKSRFGAVYLSNRRDEFKNQTIARTGIPSGQNWNSQHLNILNENILNYNQTFGDKHHVNLMAGFTVQDQKGKSSYISGTNFANDLVPTLNAAGAWTGNTTMSENTLLSYLGRVQYAFADKYLLSAGLRTDGSSRFGENTKWGLFPSVSAGWRIDQEEFLKSVEPINRLKLRTSWGKTGNNNIGDYAAIPTLSQTVYNTGMNEKVTIGMYPSNIASPDLSWETTTTFDVGADIGLWDNRLSLSVDYYNSQTSNLLLNVPIPLFTGFSSELRNIGKVENKGWEFEINTVNIDHGGFRWTSNLNLSLNQNKVVSMGDNDAPIIEAEPFITTVGKPIGSYYAYKQIGVYKNQAEVDADPAARAGTRPGDIKIENTDTDDEITPDDRQIFGSNIPKYHFGFSNQFTYKGIDLGILLTGVGGNQIFNTVARQQSRQFYSQYQHYSHWVNRWRSPEDPGDGMTPRASDKVTGMGAEWTSADFYNGAYIRLKNITLGYTLPPAFIRKLHLSNLRIYVTADNVYLWDHYIGYTPEADQDSGNARTSGRDYGVYPSVRSILFGLNVTF